MTSTAPLADKGSNSDSEQDSQAGDAREEGQLDGDSERDDHDGEREEDDQAEFMNNLLEQRPKLADMPQVEVQVAGALEDARKSKTAPPSWALAMLGLDQQDHLAQRINQVNPSSLAADLKRGFCPRQTLW